MPTDVLSSSTARTGSFGKAATSLGYTQSAVSQQIAALERIVGQRLVERPGGPKPVSLTEAGRLLLTHADAIAARVAAAQADLTALSDGQAGTLSVGVFQSVGQRVLPEVMRRFITSWPQVRVTLTESGDDTELLGFVERGDLDLTFSDLPLIEGPFESVELLRDPQRAEAMAARAREEVVAKRDIRGMTERLVDGYRTEVARKRATFPSTSP